MHDGGFVIVRSRRFPSQETREQFKEIANKWIERDSGVVVEIQPSDD